MSIILAIIVGLAFGFVLHRVGAGNPQYIINMLRLQDLHLAKVILFAIGTSSLLLFILLATGLINESHISIKAAYTGVIVGGLIFGIGFAVGGYCPGTCLVGFGGGRKDALYFILGGLIGAGAFTLMYGWLSDVFPSLFEKIAGGKTTLADTGIEKYQGLVGGDGVPAFVIAGIIAIIFMIGAWKLPKKFNV
ncbi:MAG: YeeE/YedE thiosulfate transporter family protein [Enterobacterales bacterium]|nr:YeeE/YedE thiosulfate transporter family protein [Enterobacterales bacterium]